MSKHRRIIALLACVALAALAAAVFPRSREPSYGGRTLSQWLEICQSSGTPKVPWQQGEKAAEAIRAIGTNALPCLLEWIRFEPSPWETRLRKVGDTVGVPPAMARLVFGDSRFDRSFEAAQGFQILGSTARPALPDLLQMVNNTNSRFAGDMALDALAYLGEGAVGPVAQLLTNANHPRHRYGPKAAYEMSYLGTNASPLVPLLARCTKDANWNFALGAVDALGSLRLLPEVSVPALTNCLTHPDASIRRWAVEALRNFKFAARPALPALLAARDDPDYSVRASTESLLAEIAPEAFTNAPPR